MMRKITILCEFCMLVCFVAVITPETSKAHEHRYYPGWIWDTVEVRGGAANSDYDVELHFHTCKWYVSDSGTTDGDGDDTNRNTRWGPNDGIGPLDDNFRIHYTSGPKKCTYEYGKIKGRSGTGTRNSNASGCVVPMPQEKLLYEGLVYKFQQNVQEELNIWEEAAWLQSGSNFQMMLPEHFTFDGIPVVSSTSPSDLHLGIPYLSEDSDMLVVPIISNEKLNPLEGIDIEVNILFDGNLPIGDYFYEFAGTFNVTHVLEPEIVLYSLGATSNALGFQVIPEPATVLVLGLGILALLRRHRG